MGFQHTRKGSKLLTEIRDLEKCAGIFPGKKIEIERGPMEEYLVELKREVSELSDSEIRGNQLRIEIERRERKRYGEIEVSKK